MFQPTSGDTLKRVLDGGFLGGLFRFSLGHRIDTRGKELAGFAVPFPGLRQRNIGILSQRHQLLFAFKPIGPALELPAGRLAPEVKPASITHAVGFIRSFGPFDLRIGQSGHAIPPRSRKVHPPGEQNTPKSTPIKTRLHLDAHGRIKV